MAQDGGLQRAVNGERGGGPSQVAGKRMRREGFQISAVSQECPREASDRQAVGRASMDGAVQCVGVR